MIRLDSNIGLPLTDDVSKRDRRPTAETLTDDDGPQPISLADTQMAMIWARRMRAELLRRLSTPPEVTAEPPATTGVRRRKLDRYACPAELHQVLQRYPLHRLHTGDAWVLVEALEGGPPEVLIVREIGCLPPDLQRPRMKDYPPLPKPLRQPLRRIVLGRNRQVG